MKKSQGITLTVVAAVAMATALGQAPDTPGAPVPATGTPGAPADANPCAATPIPANCLSAAHNGFTEARIEGFGATARRHPVGG